MEAAWDYSTGDNSVVLAIIDKGTDWFHEDLNNNIWINLAEQNGMAGYDDDTNNFVDDYYGWDFHDDDNTVHGVTGHGTAVAGIAAAETNNYENGSYRGVTGIAGGWGTSPGIKLMIVRIKSGSEAVFQASALEGLNYAVANGADVINMSFGWFNDYEHWRNTINDATNVHDCILVASSGNDESASIPYPAKYANTIAVGATDAADLHWYRSNRGPELDVVAPTNVPTTSIGNTYISNFSGTSASAPHVSGIAALIKFVFPSLFWYEVRAVIDSSADKVAGMTGQNFTPYYGYGRVNAHHALAPPAQITGFYLSGAFGQHPVAHWNLSLESDVIEYQIWRKLTDQGSTYNLLGTVDKNTNQFTDYEVYVGSDGKFVPHACYIIRAVDVTQQTSPFTSGLCKPYLLGRTVDRLLPEMYALHASHPNPFNPLTAIKYSLPEDSYVAFRVFDLLGREIRSLTHTHLAAGYKRILWDGTDNGGREVPSGIYTYSLEARSLETDKRFSQTKRMVLLR